MFAASGGHVDVLKAMQRGPSLLDLTAEDGGTPAMSAAAHGFGDVLQLIIDKKCNLNAQDEDGWTALMYAVCAGNVENVARLVAAGADVKIKNKDGDDAKKLATGKNKDKLLAALRGKLDSIGEVREARRDASSCNRPIGCRQTQRHSSSVDSIDAVVARRRPYYRRDDPHLHFNNHAQTTVVLAKYLIF